MNILGFKIMRQSKYKTLCLTIINAGRMARKYTKIDSYTNFGQSAKVPINDISLIHCIENVVWDDVKDEVLIGIQEGGM